MATLGDYIHYNYANYKNSGTNRYGNNTKDGLDILE